jgi:hypothetical protein
MSSLWPSLWRRVKGPLFWMVIGAAVVLTIVLLVVPTTQ